MATVILFLFILHYTVDHNYLPNPSSQAAFAGIEEHLV